MMSSQDNEDQDLLRNEECSSKWPIQINQNAVESTIEQLLKLLVYQHPDYLEAHNFPERQAKEITKNLKDILSQVPGKIFPVNVNFVEPQVEEDGTNFLEYVIECVNSKCKYVLGMEKGTDAKNSKDKTEKNFYKKLFCLINGANTDCATRSNEEPTHTGRRIVTTSSSNHFGQSTCSVEQKVNELEAKLKNERAEFRARITTLEENLKKTEEALNEIATEYYSLKKESEKKRREAIFRELLQLNHADSTSSTEIPQTSSTSEETSDNDSGDSEDRMSREESSSEAEQSLANVPTNATELELYNIYKLLLLQISERLLADEKLKLKDWAATTYSVASADTYQTLVELDKKGIISSSNLTALRDFFDGIIRIDLVVIIDFFLTGDYTHLRSVKSARNGNQHTRANMAPRANRERPMNVVVVHPRDQATVQDQATVESSKFSTEEVAVGVEQRFGCGAANNQSLQVKADVKAGQVVVDGNYNDAGSNGNKLSKPRRASEPQHRRNENRQCSETSIKDTNGDPWLCEHYKRRCLVKFDCCAKYWPCHRCHNNKSNCGRRKLKSRDIRLIKCAHCQREQPFNEGSQFCSGCGIKFAEYFCAKCKHLTGLDDSPYHCDKCGICRIHGDRSFHCDVCGVCLDVQLQNNHKCRAGSAHDECCICLEDAFTGCQILPCSHKVHKECATQMIRSGITRCPICRESFAHKLERRAVLKPYKKHQGKK